MFSRPAGGISKNRGDVSSDRFKTKQQVVGRIVGAAVVLILFLQQFRDNSIQFLES
jgi:hypothetical protein